MLVCVVHYDHLEISFNYIIYKKFFLFVYISDVSPLRVAMAGLLLIVAVGFCF